MRVQGGAGAADQVAIQLASGALRHLPPQRFALAEIAAAHEDVEQGLGRGPVVLSLPD
ncbi:MAG: zinc-binding dehydrogenase [Inhella sp.]